MNSGRLIGNMLLLVVLASQVTMAQVTTGTILGTVSDSTGAVIPGATVTIRNVETGISRTVTSDAAGHYRAPQLGLGNYEITAEVPGFQSVVRSGINLTIGREAVVDFTLQVGAVAERITVTGEAPLIETTTATVANLVSERAMRELPLNGRSFTDLTAIQPGVVTDMGIPSGVFQGGGRMVIGGARPQQSLYLLDGTDIASPYSNVAPVSVMNQTLGVDTIREYTVIQNNYGAQYGRAIGGIMNAVTRSGTNEIHGSAFEFLRNEKLDAKNFFDLPDEPIPPFKRNQFGGTVGGPIVRDNTFFFFSYEGLRQVLGTTDFDTVLSDEARGGQITGCPSPLRSCNKEQRIISETVTVHSDIKPIINLIPHANALYLNDGLQERRGSRTQPGRENYYMFRIDQRLSDNDNIFGRAVIDSSSKELLDAQFLPDGRHTSTDDDGFYNYLTLEWTRILSPSVLNVARFGFARNNNQQCACIEGTDTDANEFPGLPLQLQIIPGVPWGGNWGVPGVNVSGGHNGPGTFSIGASLNDPLHFVDNTFSYGDSVRIAKGDHSLDIGIDIRRYQQNALITTWGHGATSWFDPMKNFLTAGTCPGCRGINSITTTGVTAPPDVYRGWRQTYSSWYVQDDFQLFSNLTLNLGLRWERVTAPVEVNGKTATIKDVLRDSEWTQLGDDTLFQLRDPWKGFAPRLGFAYSPDQSTSIRGGVGAFKEIPLEYMYQLAIFYPPFAERVTVRNIRRWPNPLQGIDPAGAGRQPLLISHDFKYPHAYQWNLGVERQFGQVWVVKATYIGTRGTNLVAVINQVQPVVSTDAQGRLFTARNAPSINPFLDSTRTNSNVGDSFYNALQFQVQKRFSYGLEFSVAYTWSKNLGIGGLGVKQAETGGSAGIGGGFQVGNTWNFKAYDRSRLDQDTPHNFVFNYTYELPVGSGRAIGSNMGKVADTILGGWQINGIFTARSGLPTTITGAGYSPASFCRTCELRPTLKPGGDNNPVIGDVTRWFDETQFEVVPQGYFGNVGRNTLSIDNLSKVDLSVFKSFHVSERANLQFRAEFFNLPNHPNFGGPDSAVFRTDGSLNPNVGRIRRTIGTSRQIQLGVKIDF
ncbi:MAG: TonB-dependent receptor [Acidobacteria bacterium]|nr:TonB-dependent receptor [Acidobacteriota bacterium]